MIAVGEVVAGKYRVDHIIGQGGMGVVAAATHVQLGQQVAIKVLHDELASDPGFVSRMIREARASAQLRSEHVCRVSDVGQLASGAPYIVMELLEGADLARVVADHSLPIATAVDHVLQACVVLAEAHAAGIIHRDLKPGNLFLTKRHDGSPLIKVLDFGIAKAPGGDLALTRTAAVLGSPRYMSPEQLRSARDVDARTDIWALGVILYELVSQRVPFPAESITELAVKVAVDPPQPLDTEPAFRDVIWQCLEKPVDRRFQNVAALATALTRFASPASTSALQIITNQGRPSARALPPVIATAPTAVDTTMSSGAMSVQPPPAKRGRAVSLAVFGGVAVALGAGAFAMWPKHEAVKSIADARQADARASDAREIDTPPPPADASIDAPPDIQAQLRAAYRAKDWDKVIAYAHQLSRRGRLSQDIDELYAQASQTIINDAQPAIDDKLALRDCPGARALAKKAFARADKWDTLIDQRITECEKAHPTLPTEHDIAQAIKQLDYAKAIRLGETALSHDPNDQGVLELTGMAACYAKDRARAQKYLNALTNSETRQSRLSMCRGMGNDVH